MGWGWVGGLAGPGESGGGGETAPHFPSAGPGSLSLAAPPFPGGISLCLRCCSLPFLPRLLSLSHSLSFLVLDSSMGAELSSTAAAGVVWFGPGRLSFCKGEGRRARLCPRGEGEMLSRESESERDGTENGARERRRR